MFTLKFFKLLQTYFVIYIFLVSFVFIECVDLNVRVDIINQIGADLPASGVQTLNYNWQSDLPLQKDQLRTLKTKLTLSASSITAPIQLTQPANINIVCTQSSAADSNFASFTFNTKPVSALVSNTNVDIEFKINKAGIAPLVSCTGVLVNFPNQNIAGVDLTGVKFVDSAKVRIQVLSHPSISFNPNQESTTSFETSPYLNSYFSLFLRDVVELHDVSITCSISPTDSGLTFNDAGASSNSLGLTAGIGSNSVTINYLVSLAKLTNLNSFEINCFAQSNGVIGFQQQYQATLAKASAKVKFIVPKIDFQTSFGSKFYGSDIKIPLKLNPTKPDGPIVKVQCELKRFSSQTDLDIYQASITPNNCPKDMQAPTLTPDQSASTPIIDQITYDRKGFDWYFIDALNSSSYSQVREFQIQNSNDATFLQISRLPLNPLRVKLTVYVSLFCCDSTNAPTSQLIKYANAKSALVFELPANANPSTIEAFSSPSAADLLDPVYNPCSCDLTIDKCDRGCCCDEDCSEADFQALNLKCPVQVRPVFDKIVNEWTCTDVYNRQRLNEPDWFPIICVHANTTVLLGKFYSPKTLDDFVTNKKDEFLSKIGTLVRKSYNTRSRYLNDPLNTGTQITSSDYCTLDPNLSLNYTANTCILTAALVTDTDPSDYLVLPTLSNSISSCLYDSPVRFLKNSPRSFCSIKIDQTNCRTNPNFDFKTFAGKLIFQSPMTPNAKVKVEYEYVKCKTPFLDSATSSSSQSTLICNTGTGQIAFDANSKLFDGITDGSICYNDSWSYSAFRNSAINNEITSDYYLRPDISNNNCQIETQLQSPSEIGPICSNVVSGVKYILFWNGGSVKKVLARIILTDVQLDTKPITIKQMFEAKWNYLPSANDQFNLLSVDTMTKYENVITSEAYLKSLRSGIKGYQKGKPIVSGYKSDTAGAINTQESQRINNLRVLNGKLCGIHSKLERQPIKFAENSTSNCVVRVAKADLKSDGNCKYLRRVIFNKMNDYFLPSNYISKNGNPNITTFDPNDWISVYPVNRAFTFNDTADSEFSFYTCKNVPSTIKLYNFYVDVGKSKGEEFYEIIGSYISYSLSNWSYVCKGNKKDCSSSDEPNDFEVQFQTIWIRNIDRNLTWLDRCKGDLYPSQYCLQEVFWTWPKNPEDVNFFYLYAVHLGLLFGIFSLIIVYVMIIGFVCPC